MRDGVRAVQDLYETDFSWTVAGGAEGPEIKTTQGKLRASVVKSFIDTGLKKAPAMFDNGASEPYYKQYSGKDRTIGKKRGKTTQTVEEFIAPKNLKALDISLSSMVLPIDQRSDAVLDDDNEPLTEDEDSDSASSGDQGSGFESCYEESE